MSDAGLQIFKADGRQHWTVLRDGAAVGFIAQRGNGHTAVRFVAMVDGRAIEARPPHPRGGFGSVERARLAVRRAVARQDAGGRAP